MTDWLLKALGAKGDDAVAVVDWSLRWQTETWGLAAAVLILIFAFLAWFAYRKSPPELKAGRRWVLTLLRTAFLALLVALLLQPVLVLTLEREVPRTLPVLVDTTGSMGITDGGKTRLEQVREGLTGQAGTETIRNLNDGLEVPLLTFTADGIETFERDGESLEPAGETTALGDTLAKALERYRGATLAGFVLVTDGNQNAGLPLAEAGALLKRAGVPVFAVGVGNAAARDVAVEGVEVAEVLLADDAAPVTVRLRSQGMQGESGRVVISLGGVQVAEKEVDFEEDGRQEIQALFIPKRPGEYPLEVRFEPAGVEEAVAQNNESRTTLRVVDRRLRVLLIDQAPRWEYRYLEAMLLRERRVALSCFLFEADPEVARVPGSPYIERFPLRREELFGYDLVILGDVDPHLFTDAHQALLRNYVSEAGGALVVLAGKRFMPEAFRRSGLERLLPVELAGTAIGTSSASAAKPLRLSLTKDGEESVMLRLGDTPEASIALWRRLPPVFWAAAVKRAKPAAEVLLTRPDPLGTGDGVPVVALQRYGAGEVIFVGTDNFWRWRRNVGDRYHSILWGQIIQRMAGQRLLSEVPRARMQTVQHSYRHGERVQVYARLFAPDWEPRIETVVPAVVVAGDEPDARRAVTLHAVPAQAGMYRAEFSAGDAGNYRLSLIGDEAANLSFTVRDDNRELARAAMNAPLLQELAAQTGGAFLQLDQLGQLPALLTDRTARITKPREVDLWSSSLVFGLLVLLITIEWIVRKVSELK